MDADLIELGRIVRLQVQRSSLKVGSLDGKYYDPEPLLAVDEIVVDASGASVERPGGPVLDVHNALHPRTKNRNNINPLSVGFVGHYEQIRQRYGAHITDGIAGENILVDASNVVDLPTVATGFVITGDEGRRIELDDVSVAHPCVEFSRFVMNDRNAPARMVSDVLRFLDGGIRGFYAVAAEGRHELRVGDTVYARRLASS